MALFTTYRVQDVLPAIGSDSAAGNPRINNRAELVVAHSLEQAVQDGRVFQATNAAMETATAGQTAFTTDGVNPFFYLGVPSGTSVRPLNVRLTQGGSVANDAFTVLIAYENAVLYSSGGTAISKNNLRTDDPNTSATTTYTGATITAPSDDRTLFAGIFTQNVADPKHSDDSFLWEDKCPPILVGPASFLIYAYVATTAPSLFFRVVWAEWSTTQVT